MEYYIYYLHTDGYEDLAWYTEGINEVTKKEAMNKFREIQKSSVTPIRLYQIDRINVKPGKQYSELLIEG